MKSTDPDKNNKNFLIACNEMIFECFYSPFEVHVQVYNEEFSEKQFF